MQMLLALSTTNIIIGLMEGIEVPRCFLPLGNLTALSFRHTPTSSPTHLMMMMMIMSGGGRRESLSCGIGYGVHWADRIGLSPRVTLEVGPV